MPRSSHLESSVDRRTQQAAAWNDATDRATPIGLGDQTMAYPTGAVVWFVGTIASSK